VPCAYARLIDLESFLLYTICSGPFLQATLNVLEYQNCKHVVVKIASRSLSEARLFTPAARSSRFASTVWRMLSSDELTPPTFSPTSTAVPIGDLEALSPPHQRLSVRRLCNSALQLEHPTCAAVQTLVGVIVGCAQLLVQVGSVGSSMCFDGNTLMCRYLAAHSGLSARRLYPCE